MEQADTQLQGPLPAHKAAEHACHAESQVDPGITLLTLQPAADGVQLHEHRVLWPLLEQLSQALLCGTHRDLQKACLLHIWGLDVDVPCRQPKVVTRCAAPCVVVLKIMTNRRSEEPPAEVFAGLIEVDLDRRQSLHSMYE